MNQGQVHLIDFVSFDRPTQPKNLTCRNDKIKKMKPIRSKIPLGPRFIWPKAKFERKKG